MSAAISTDTSHSTVTHGQLGQNLLGRLHDFLKDKSICLWFLSHYTVYYGKEIGCYSLFCEQPGANGRVEHVSLPFLMQPKETYDHKCHCSSTSHKHWEEWLSTQPLTSWTAGWRWQWWWWGPQPKLDPSPTTSRAAPSHEPLLTWPGLGLSRDWLKMSSGREKNRGKVQVHESQVILELYATLFLLIYMYVALLRGF